MIIRPSNISIQPGKNLGLSSAIVLAGGDGTRLGASTTSAMGEVIPKQYCSLGATPCLLQQAVSRAMSVTGGQAVWPVVARGHERWWRHALNNVTPEHIVIQPANKGTGLGILLGLLTLEREEGARTVLILPADHYVADETIFLKALRRLTQWSQRDPDCIYLLGAEPEEPDPTLGYILPWFDARFAPIGVYEFIERPRAIDARKLINRGALWNTFIVAASRQALLRAFTPRYAAQIEALREAINRPTDSLTRLEDQYRLLSSIDFSHDILEHHSDTVQVLRLPACGWTELGSVSRIQKALTYSGSSIPLTSTFLDLGESSRDRRFD